MVITRNHELGFGRKVVEMDRTSLPQLSKQLRDRKNSQKTEKNKKRISKISKNLKILIFQIWGF